MTMIEEAREACVQAWRPKGRRPMFNMLLLELFDDAMLAVHVAACGFEEFDEGDLHECGQDGWLCATALRLQGGTHDD